MDSKSSIYNLRGVSSQKEEVAAAVKKNSSGVFPGAFCKAVNNSFNVLQPPAFQNSQDTLFLSHADGTGSKSTMAYLYWKETEDVSIFADLAQDALVMNTDDLLCVGCVDDFFFTSTIARNKNRIPGEVLSTLIEGVNKFLATMREWGVNCELMGGETADLGDVVKTLTVDVNAVTFIHKNNFIDTSKIKPGLAIIGFASAGQTLYESSYNSGIASNGLTSARHDLLYSSYRKKYPETYDETIAKNLVYCGNYQVEDTLSKTPLNIGKALLSPTRTYLPVVKKIVEEYPSAITAMLHLTGGGQTKCLKFGKGIHYVKDNLFELPPLFQALAESSFYSEAPEELYKVFNCGHRLELYVEEKWTTSLMAISEDFGLPAKVVGYTDSLTNLNNLKKNTIKKKLLNNYLTINVGKHQHNYHS